MEKEEQLLSTANTIVGLGEQEKVEGKATTECASCALVSETSKHSGNHTNAINIDKYSCHIIF